MHNSARRLRAGLDRVNGPSLGQWVELQSTRQLGCNREVFPAAAGDVGEGSRTVTASIALRAILCFSFRDIAFSMSPLRWHEQALCPPQDCA